MTSRLDTAIAAALVLGLVGCIVGIVLEGSRFYAAWLCTYLFWLGLPLGAVTLTLVHDLTGGGWMETARPALNAAIATMPLASIAGMPALTGLDILYTWPDAADSANHFYLNAGFFAARYAVDLVVWNAAAAYALYMPRGLTAGIAPSLSWVSGIGLLLLAYTTSFAAIDWILSLAPHFWSAIFPMIAGAAWFDTGLAIVVLVVALGPVTPQRRSHMRDLAALFFAMVIFWGYVEFCQFLIVWEADLASEIPWFLHRIADGWRSVTWLIAIGGFAAPFFLLLWGPTKRSRLVVTAACVVFLAARLLHAWWQVLPELPSPRRPDWWFDLSAMLTLGSSMVLVFRWRLRGGMLPRWPIARARAAR